MYRHSQFNGFANMSITSSAVNESFLLAGLCRWNNNELHFDFGIFNNTYPIDMHPYSAMNGREFEFGIEGVRTTIRFKTIRPLSACYGLMFTGAENGRKMLEIVFVLYANNSPYSRMFDISAELFRNPPPPSSLSSVYSYYKSFTSETSSLNDTETSLKGFFTLKIEIPFFDLDLPLRGRCSVEGTELNLFFPNHDMSAELPVVPMQHKDNFKFDIKHSKSTIRVYMRYFAESNVFLGRGWMVDGTDRLGMMVCFYAPNNQLDMLPMGLVS